MPGCGRPPIDSVQIEEITPGVMFLNMEQTLNAGSELQDSRGDMAVSGYERFSCYLARMTTLTLREQLKVTMKYKLQ